MKKLILLASISLVLQTSLHAQTSPRLLSYQGVIRSSGVDVVGNHSLVVTLYGDASGTIKLWQGTLNTPIDSSGVFNCLLGTSDNPLPSAAVMDQPLWLGVAVDTGAELHPLSPMTASPYALNVADQSISANKLIDRVITTNKLADTSVTTPKIADGSVTTSKIADSSITPEKMNLNYVSSINVNSIPVTGNGGFLNLTGGNGINLSWDAKTSSISIAGTKEISGGGGMQTLSVDSTVGFYFGGSVPGPHANATNVVLHGEPSGGAHGPTWGPVNLTMDVGTSILPLANGGTNNIPQWGTIAAGINSATNLISVVAGGSEGIADNYAATVGGGFYNNAYGDDGVVSGGEANQVGYGDTTDGNSFHSAVGGGAANSAYGIGTAIPGGVSLTLGSHSFGFNGDSVLPGREWRADADVPKIAEITDLSATGANLQQIAYFGNVNMMLGNVDGAARALQFYSPQTSHTYSSAKYSSFQAGSQTGNIIYTLPTSLPSINQFLKVYSVSGSDVYLSWDTVTGGSGGGGGSFWSTTGNTSVPPPSYYLGTNDSEAFEIHVNNSGYATGGNQRVMRYAPGPSSPSITGGSSANTISANLSGAAILSGGSTLGPNIVTDSFSVIAGGDSNKIQGNYSMIGGGEDNSITFGGASAIVAGISNEIDMSSSFIGAGQNNRIVLGSSGIVAGGDNFIDTSNLGFIGAGGSDTILSESSASGIAAGLYDKIGTNTWTAFIGAGESNTILNGTSSLLGSGFGNLINAIGMSDTGHVCLFTIGSVFSPGYDVLGGGQYDTIFGSLDVLAGGNQNKIDTKASASTLVGGDNNYVGASVSSLGGGYQNVILPTAYGSTIPGGAGLIAAAPGQFVAGNYNIPDSTTGPNGTLAIFGSGMEDSDRVDAFTISKLGSASAYQPISDTGGAGGLPTRMGTMYDDNTIESYGTVLPTTTSPAYDSIVLSAGVLYALRIGTGTYLVHLNIVNQNGSPQTFYPGGASITATLTPDANPEVGLQAGMIVVSQLSTSAPGSPTAPTFTVWTFDKFGNLSNGYGFHFHVVAR